jgi:YVTN family beta-propeller protein
LVVLWEEEWNARRFALKALCLVILVSFFPGYSLAQAQHVEATTIPNGRQITPSGDWISVAPFPFALALRPDGRQLVAPSLGFPFALNVIDRPASAERTVVQDPRGFLSVPGVEVYAGVAYSTDAKLLYVATGDSGAVEVRATADWHRMARINLNGALRGHIYQESFAASLVLTKDGRRLYVIDQANWRVVVIDTATKTKVATLGNRSQPDRHDVFGDLAGADGDHSLARYGMHGQVKGDPAMQDLHVTPNAHAMAARFATSDDTTQTVTYL